jgi:hypothetical protein
MIDDMHTQQPNIGRRRHSVLSDATDAPVGTEQDLHPNVAEWWRWTAVGPSRLPLPYWPIIVVVAIIALLAQSLEMTLLGAHLDGISGREALVFLSIPFIFVYVLVALRALKSGTVRLLNRIRRVVLIADDAFDAHVHAIVCIPFRIEMLLLAASIAFVSILLLPLQLPTPMGSGQLKLPLEPWQASLIILSYSLLGWLILLLIYTSVRLGRGLSRLADEPIKINVFDPLDRLPFGQLSLLHSLTLAGLILVLVIPLGRPTEVVDYVVLILLSIGSLAALVLPLRGIHRQVQRAKTDVLERLYIEFDEVQSAVMMNRDLDSAELKELSERVRVLNELRTTVLHAPTWPFRNASAAIRASLAALSPILYFAITELLRSLLQAVANTNSAN